LLSGMSEKERARHRNKGIFTVTQLSHTFRPRRTPKRAKNPAKPHHFSLQALAIRENCVYIHGSPVLPECKSKVYLDIEGLPDRDFHYLIGALIVTEERETFHSFWADTESDEATIFLQLAEAISQLPDFRVFHYGDYDAAAMKRVATGLPAGAQEQFDAILNRSVNVLSLIYPHVYFPTFSNSLKDIIPHLGRPFGNQGPTGLDSIVWRMQWEQARDPRLRKQLVEYNHSDCTGLKQLTDFVTRRIANETETRDYQRERVFIRTHSQFKAINRRAVKQTINLPSKPNSTMHVEAQTCPNCRSRRLKRDSESVHIVVDLKFSKSGIRKSVTRIVSWRYNCEKCGKSFRSENRLPNPQRLGHALVS